MTPILKTSDLFQKFATAQLESKKDVKVYDFQKKDKLNVNGKKLLKSKYQFLKPVNAVYTVSESDYNRARI